MKIALVGRPNVGKSTLFNRLVGKRLALVDDTPGVTRDRREGEGRLGDLVFTVIDTPGLEEAPIAALEGRMRAQTDRAVAEADLCLFMIDARAGVTPLDRTFASILRASGKPVLLLANKAEGARGDAGVYDAYELGIGDPIPLSAEHGEGMGELAVAMQPIFDAAKGEEAGDNAQADDAANWDDPLKPLRVAIVGRPNAGKSTLVNKLIGEDRLLTGPEAGITRDSIGVEWRWQGPDRDWPVKVYDTAGMRKKAKVQSKLEKLSVADALRAVKFAEVVVLLLDATAPFEKQDLQIADLALREGRALVVAINKWDLVEDRNAAFAELRAEADRLLPQAPGLPLIPISALTGAGLEKLMPAIVKVYIDWNARVKTPDLNDWLQEAVHRHTPPAVAGRRIRFKYISQTKTRPPTFVAQCNLAHEVPAAYKRYLVNGIREAFDIKAVPIRLNLRSGDNPYAKEKKR
ncbi:MAG: ribosome biogenesis GTPase Der [Pseudomonadota bacterium]